MAVLSGPAPSTDEALSAWLASCTDWTERYGSTVDRWTRGSRILACASGDYGLFTVAAQRSLDLLAEQGFDRDDLKALQQQRCEDATVLFDCP